PGTVESSETVCLANGARIGVRSDGVVGSQVAISLRPERVEITDRSAAPEGRPVLDGSVASVTFLGSSIVYQVALDWLTVEVRTENRPSVPRREVGDEVTLWWRDDAVAVVPG
ncbi:MAG: TOBE domain-containing protein, partial [Ilumatobacteraceae bacterium]